jgi:hypothetical protein
MTDEGPTLEEELASELESVKRERESLLEAIAKVKESAGDTALHAQHGRSLQRNSCWLHDSQGWRRQPVLTWQLLGSGCGRGAAPMHSCTHAAHASGTAGSEGQEIEIRQLLAELEMKKSKFNQLRVSGLRTRLPVDTTRSDAPPTSQGPALHTRSMLHWVRHLSRANVAHASDEAPPPPAPKQTLHRSRCPTDRVQAPGPQDQQDARR